jgi:CRISP-associated protein Cas1
MADSGRVLDFSLGQAHLCLRYRQLIIERDGMPDASVPMDEIAVVILCSRRVTVTVAALDGLTSSGATIVVCDERSLPSGMMLPLAGHFQQTQRMRAQAVAPLPLQKRIWQEIVRAKVESQGSLLAGFRGDDAGLMAMSKRVRSGDPDNIEAQAAQRYWPALFADPDFRRRFDAANENALLNYGYAVLRAAVGRAICAAGLHPSIGVHHHGRNNPFCLADDLMEPYRPVIDGVVAVIADEQPGMDPALDPPTKARLVGVLHETLPHEGEDRPVIDWISRSASSLARRLCGESSEPIFFPSGLVTP